MIALFSAQIEAGARAFATVLVNLLPFLPDSLVTNPEQIMIVVGLAAKAFSRCDSSSSGCHPRSRRNP